MKRKRYKKKKDALNSENKTFYFLGQNSVDSVSEKLRSCSTRKFFWVAIILNPLGGVGRLVDLAALLYPWSRMEVRKGGEKKPKLCFQEFLFPAVFLFPFEIIIFDLFFFFEMYCKCQNKLFPLYHALFPFKEVCC